MLFLVDYCFRSYIWLFIRIQLHLFLEELQHPFDTFRSFSSPTHPTITKLNMKMSWLNEGSIASLFIKALFETDFLKFQITTFNNDRLKKFFGLEFVALHLNLTPSIEFNLFTTFFLDIHICYIRDCVNVGSSILNIFRTVFLDKTMPIIKLFLFVHSWNLRKILLDTLFDDTETQNGYFQIWCD